MLSTVSVVPLNVERSWTDLLGLVGCNAPDGQDKKTECERDEYDAFGDTYLWARQQRISREDMYGPQRRGPRQR